VPNHAIRRALHVTCAQTPGVTIIPDAAVAGVDNRHDGVTVRLGDGQRLHARLLVAADLRFSRVRDMLGIGAQINRLGRSMMVVRWSMKPTMGIALEWFDYGQTYAMLPLNGAMSSAVLTLPSDAINRLMALSSR
jgi:2-polyprenyl-6-methoxyphenol hydroxylase-like FAD-dependent oxidoreductase